MSAAHAEAKKLHRRHGGTVVVAIVAGGANGLNVDIGSRSTRDQSVDDFTFKLEAILQTLAQGQLEHSLESACDCRACADHQSRLRQVLAVLAGGEAVSIAPNLEGSAVQ